MEKIDGYVHFAARPTDGSVLTLAGSVKEAMDCIYRSLLEEGSNPSTGRTDPLIATAMGLMLSATFAFESMIETLNLAARQGAILDRMAKGMDVQTAVDQVVQEVREQGGAGVRGKAE